MANGTRVAPFAGMSRWWFGVMAVALTCWAACGEEFVGFDDDGAGGSTSSSSTSSSTSVGAGGGSTCGFGNPCFVEGDTCTDGACCPCTYICENGQWSQQACAGCAEPGCPPEPPTHGQTCGECSSPSFACSYESCGDFGVGTAQCNGTQWEVDAEPCKPAPICGDVGAPCADDEICVRTEITVGPSTEVTYSCEPHPCQPFETTCGCAQQVCQDKSAPQCAVESPRMLNCWNEAQ
jgi:hypothetical protein